MHFSYVKSNISRKWSNILRKCYVTMFTQNMLYSEKDPSLSYHQASHPTWPASPPCPPQGHQTLPATRPCPPPEPTLPPEPARHLTKPSIPPSPPAFPDSLAVLLSHDGVASVATRWLVPSSSSCKGCVPHLIFNVPPPIFCVNLTCEAIDT